MYVLCVQTVQTYQVNNIEKSLCRGKVLCSNQWNHNESRFDWKVAIFRNLIVYWELYSFSNVPSEQQSILIFFCCRIILWLNFSFAWVSFNFQWKLVLRFEHGNVTSLPFQVIMTDRPTTTDQPTDSQHEGWPGKISFLMSIRPSNQNNVFFCLYVLFSIPVTDLFPGTCIMARILSRT